MSKNSREKEVKELEEKLKEIEREYIECSNKIVKSLENSYDSTIKYLNVHYGQDVIETRNQKAMLDLIKIIQDVTNSFSNPLPVDIEYILTDHNYIHLVIILESLKLF